MRQNDMTEWVTEIPVSALRVADDNSEKQAAHILQKLRAFAGEHAVQKLVVIPTSGDLFWLLPVQETEVAVQDVPALKTAHKDRVYLVSVP